MALRGTELVHLKAWFTWSISLSFLPPFVLCNIPSNQIKYGNPLILLCNLILEMSGHNILDVIMFTCSLIPFLLPHLYTDFAHLCPCLFTFLFSLPVTPFSSIH